MDPRHLLHRPANRRAFRSSTRTRCGSCSQSSGLGRANGGENPASALHRLAILPGSPAPAPARRPNLGVPSRPHAGECWLSRDSKSRARSWIQRLVSGARARRVRKEETFRAGGERARVPVAAGIPSNPPAGTRGHCRKPTRPSQATSRSRQPILHAEATHWLRSFISRGASLFPVGRPVSLAASFSAS